MVSWQWGVMLNCRISGRSSYEDTEDRLIEKFARLTKR